MKIGPTGKVFNIKEPVFSKLKVTWNEDKKDNLGLLIIYN